MPNWCENHLSIQGTEEDLAAFKALASDGKEVMCFNRIKPQPEDIGDKWYDWRVQNWGTKWEPDTDQLNEWDESPGVLMGTFMTAWAPPDGVFDAASKLFPELAFTLEYCESGCDFSGAIQWFGGEKTGESEGS